MRAKIGACGQRSPLRVTARHQHQDEENGGQSWVVMQERVEDDDDDWPWCVLTIVVRVCFLVCGESLTNNDESKSKIVNYKILLRAYLGRPPLSDHNYFGEAS